MHAKAVYLLTDPQPGDHIVYPYTAEDRLAEAVSLYASSGLAKGEGVVLITTDSHRKAIERRLIADTVDVERLKSSGQLIFLNAEKVLSQFMVDGMPDANLFKTIADSLILRAKTDTDTGRFRKIRLFGEMVNLMWDNNPASSLRLEELWNAVIDEHSVPLLCAYSLHGQANGQLSTKVCGTHTHSLDAQMEFATAN